MSSLFHEFYSPPLHHHHIKSILSSIINYRYTIIPNSNVGYISSELQIIFVTKPHLWSVVYDAVLPDTKSYGNQPSTLFTCPLQPLKVTKGNAFFKVVEPQLGWPPGRRSRRTLSLHTCNSLHFIDKPTT